MNKKRLAVVTIVILLVSLLASISVPAFAAADFTVTFYTNKNKAAIHETQKVAMGGHPTVPATVPASYEASGFRYEFDGWYWTVDRSDFEFSFTDEDCEIWGDTDIFAGYAQYLAEGYELIVVYSGGTVFLTDYVTPIKELLKAYSGITNVYAQVKPDYETGSGNDDPPHTHSYDYSNPVWNWKVEDGNTVAVATYTCSCGETTTETIIPSFSDSQGVRTYTAVDSHGNEASTTKELSFNVTFNGEQQDAIYHWGDVCTLTADGPKAWYVNSAASQNRVADGTTTYTFAVVSNTTILTGNTDYTEQQAAVMASLRSPESGKAVFNAIWSLPDQAQVLSVKIYRGFTSIDKTVSADTIITRGEVFDTELLVRNGNYTLNINGLTSTKYQHVVIEVRYAIGGNSFNLVSTPQKVLPDGTSA